MKPKNSLKKRELTQNIFLSYFTDYIVRFQIKIQNIRLSNHPLTANNRFFRFRRFQQKTFFNYNLINSVRIYI